jgi:hypothetical protein
MNKESSFTSCRAALFWPTVFEIRISKLVFAPLAQLAEQVTLSSKRLFCQL